MAEDRDDLRAALQQNFLFKSLSPDELGTLAKSVRVESFAAGTVIVAEGDEANALFLVVKGNVNVMKSNDQFLALLGRNGFFGEMGLFVPDARRSANCVAASDTRCAIIHKDELRAFCDAEPHIGVKIYRSIIETLAERLQATSADLAMLMSTQVRSQSGVAELVAAHKKK